MKVLDDLVKGHKLTRAVLSAGIIGGILTAVFFAAFRPNPDVTFDVFYYAAKISMEGEVVHETGYGLWTYTPAALLYFYPYVLLFDYETALLVHQVLSVPVAIFYGAVLARFIGRHTEIQKLDKFLIIGFTSASVYPIVNVINGSFVGIFTAALGLGWILLEYDSDLGGAAWALASIIKGFPAFWGIYLLRTRRWRATGVAIATGVGATLVGVLMFGIDAYLRFFTVAGGNRVRLELFRNGGSPDTEPMTPLRGLAQIFPNVDPAVWPPIIFIVVACLTLAIFYLIPTNTLNDRATLLLATIIGVTFVMPTSQDMDTYLVYAPLLVLLYVERHAIVQTLYAAGTVLLSYNVGRGELRSVSSMFGERVSEVAMAIGDPILSFAHMPMYALFALYIGCLIKARSRGRETGRLDYLKTKVRELTGKEPST